MSHTFSVAHIHLKTDFQKRVTEVIRHSDTWNINYVMFVAAKLPVVCTVWGMLWGFPKIEDLLDTYVIICNIHSPFSSPNAVSWVLYIVRIYVYWYAHLHAVCLMWIIQDNKTRMLTMNSDLEAQCISAVADFSDSFEPNISFLCWFAGRKPIIKPHHVCGASTWVTLLCALAFKCFCVRWCEIHKWVVPRLCSSVSVVTWSWARAQQVRAPIHCAQSKTRWVLSALTASHVEGVSFRQVHLHGSLKHSHSDLVLQGVAYGLKPVSVD